MNIAFNTLEQEEIWHVRSYKSANLYVVPFLMLQQTSVMYRLPVREQVNVNVVEISLLSSIPFPCTHFASLILIDRYSLLSVVHAMFLSIEQPVSPGVRVNYRFPPCSKTATYYLSIGNFP